MATGDILFSANSALDIYMSADLNALANVTTNVGAVVLDNRTNKHHHLMAEIYLVIIDLSAAVGLTVELYLVPSVDGTNYCDTGADASTTNLPPGSAHIGTFNIQKTNAIHRAAILCKECLQALLYTPVLINKTGAAFGAEGNILKIMTNSDNVSS